MLEVTELTVEYKGVSALEDITLEIPKGSCTGIIGPNGAGKSTFIKAILEMIPIKKGKVLIDDIPVSKMKRSIAYVAQRSEIDLTFPITVFDTVITGTYPNLKLLKKTGKKEKFIVEQALSKVGLSEFKSRQISNLSGGQLQRVFIARALAQNPDYFFLDEPFVGIDMISEKIIIEVLNELMKKGKTIIIVHHDLHKVTEYFNHLIIFNKKLITSEPTRSGFVTENIRRAYGDSMGDVVIKGVKK